MPRYYTDQYWFTGYTQTGFSLMFNNLCLSNEADNLVEAVLCYS